MTLSICIQCYYAEFFIVVLSVEMLNIIMLSANIVNLAMLSYKC